MLFLFGIGSSTLGPYPMPGLSCINCGTRGSLAIIILTRYFHLFWIPVFPFGKRAMTVCGNCKQALSQQEWPAEYQQLALEAKQQARYPLTNFAGLIILGVLMALGTLGGLFAGMR